MFGVTWLRFVFTNFIEVLTNFHGTFKGIVLEMAKSLIFPLPLLSVAHQQILAGIAYISYLKLSLDSFYSQQWLYVA